MNQYPAWKYVIVVAVILLCTLYALPNLFGEDPSVQISTAYASNAEVNEALQNEVEAVLKQGKVEAIKTERDKQRLLMRFSDTETQFKAYSLLRDELPNTMPGYTVAQNLVPATPAWLAGLNANPMFLGLDLRGGVHFLIEVDMETAISQDEERYVQDFRSLLRKNKLRYKSVGRVAGGGVNVAFKDLEIRAKALPLLGKEYPELEIKEQDNSDSYDLFLRYSEVELKNAKRTAVEQNITTLRNRVNELGVAEPLIQLQGEDRIVVQLPGVQDPVQAKETLQATATLEFRMVGESGPNTRKYLRREGGEVWLQRSLIVSGNQINHAASTIDNRTGRPAVSVRLDGKGAKKMNDTTKVNVGKPMAVVFIQYVTERKEVDGKIVKTRKKVEEVINVATIQEQFSKNFQITGLEAKEANNLALLLRAGALKAPIEIVEERTIGPSLGKDNIRQGMNSIILGFILVLVFMAVRYKVFGLVANFVLLLNLVILVALLSMLQATLTLPGMAGILLTIGMAVDANVLIFERIREELRNGVTPQAAIHSGYAKALSTIADANITTLIAGIVLFGFGTGPVKGFAITLSLGIISSMFTAIMVSRAIINWHYGNKKISSLSV